MSVEGDFARADVWLWRARLYKTRALAAAALRAGRIRIDGVKTAKAHAAIRPGMVLTISGAGRVTVMRVRALGVRRGPASEAQTLYEPPGDAPDA
ncbi:MAG: S4 domain-containing protein [Pseudomonadota bacterium]